MDYKLLNKIQRDRMKAISNNDYQMEWENPKFMDVLMGELPIVRHYQNDDEIKDEIKLLEKELSVYDPFSSDKKSFIENIKKRIGVIYEKKPDWYGLNLYEVEECMQQHEFCLISGEGGIGKSYFIKCLEEKLEDRKVPHLCLYGKFQKDVQDINIEEIVNESKAGFVFVVDAINEMSNSGQAGLLKLLHKLKEHSGIRFIITYRTNAMDVDILKKYQEIASAEYVFSGVSFESALDEMLKLRIPDIYKYEDILYSNNALLLGMLCKVLVSAKLTDETENGIASVTFILERYIKKAVGKSLKGTVSCQSVDVWEDTKRVARWMYEHGEKRIDAESLSSIIKTGVDFIHIMMQLGFVSEYEFEGVSYFYFSIDSLTDFLIARSLFDDIKGKEFGEQVGIIKSKIDGLYNLEEAIIIAIFDNFAPDYQYIKELLIATGLMESLQYDTLVKINFKKDMINKFLQTFSPVAPSDLLGIVGGYTDKPFNCTNYLRDYYLKNGCLKKELSEVLSDHRFLESVKGRLKNILYFIALNDRGDRRDEEAYNFALLCCAAPNKDVRCLAMKLLYEIVVKAQTFKKRLIEDYKYFTDFYIQESIIFVLKNVYSNDKETICLFNELIKNEPYISTKSIKRIALYMDDPYGYIKWDRRNLYECKTDAVISDFMDKILSRVDLMNKGFLPFRYWGKDHIDMYKKFLKNDKNTIYEINDYLEQKFQCVKNGDCNGYSAFEKRVMEKMPINIEIETLDMDSFFASYEMVLKDVFEKYHLEVDKENMGVWGEDFINSVYMKCVDIATGLYYGSLMCNYYTNQFDTYNSNQNSIGYEVYDPLEYGEEMVITSPIPTYQDFVEKLGDIVVKRIEVPIEKDINWVREVPLTRKNIVSLLDVVEVKNAEWVMLAGRVSLQEHDEHNIKWRDAYNIWCCTSEDEIIADDGNARYLTIELQEYAGNLSDYKLCKEKPWLCKSVKNISSEVHVFDEVALVLPPATLINFFELRVNTSDVSWDNKDGEKVIICNNNKNSYYRDPIGATVFIRKEYLDKYLEGNTLKYFAFAERFIPETGFADETSLHFEIREGRIVTEILNESRSNYSYAEVNPLCEECPYKLAEQTTVYNEETLKKINELLVEYGGAE